MAGKVLVIFCLGMLLVGFMVFTKPVYASGVISVTGIAVSIPAGASGSGYVATFTDSDGNTNPSLYSATINWGDTTTSSGTVHYATCPSSAPPTPTGKCFFVNGRHTYNCPAVYTVIISITDSDGDSGTGTSTITITGTGTGCATGVPEFPIASLSSLLLIALLLPALLVVGKKFRHPLV